MKKRRWLIFVALGVIAAACLIIPLSGRDWRSIVPSSRPMLPEGILRVGVDASYPPFAVDPGDGALTGLDIDLARAVAEVMGVELRFINMGYDGLYDSLRANQADVLFSALRTDPLRTRDVRYSRSYFDAGQVLV
ncbi:MAG: transporter substrate-binding domain-containing protein, partial [Anaerolineae bacterium]|nr:transporter substrate-binding domain-containing protein [Anaerolineae bacterium]